MNYDVDKIEPFNRLEKLDLTTRDVVQYANQVYRRELVLFWEAKLSCMAFVEILKEYELFPDIYMFNWKFYREFILYFITLWRYVGNFKYYYELFKYIMGKNCIQTYYTWQNNLSKRIIQLEDWESLPHYPYQRQYIYHSGDSLVSVRVQRSPSTLSTSSLEYISWDIPTGKKLNTLGTATIKWLYDAPKETIDCYQMYMYNGKTFFIPLQASDFLICEINSPNILTHGEILYNQNIDFSKDLIRCWCAFKNKIYIYLNDDVILDNLQPTNVFTRCIVWNLDTNFISPFSHDFDLKADDIFADEISNYLYVRANVNEIYRFLDHNSASVYERLADLDPLTQYSFVHTHDFDQVRVGDKFNNVVIDLDTFDLASQISYFVINGKNVLHNGFTYQTDLVLGTITDGKELFLNEHKIYPPVEIFTDLKNPNDGVDTIRYLNGDITVTPTIPSTPVSYKWEFGNGWYLLFDNTINNFYKLRLVDGNHGNQVIDWIWDENYLSVNNGWLRPHFDIGQNVTIISHTFSGPFEAGTIFDNMTSSYFYIRIDTTKTLLKSIVFTSGIITEPNRYVDLSDLNEITNINIPSNDFHSGAQLGYLQDETYRGIVHNRNIYFVPTEAGKEMNKVDMTLPYQAYDKSADYPQVVYDKKIGRLNIIDDVNNIPHMIYWSNYNGSTNRDLIIKELGTSKPFETLSAAIYGNIIIRGPQLLIVSDTGELQSSIIGEFQKGILYITFENIDKEWAYWKGKDIPLKLVANTNVQYIIFQWLRTINSGELQTILNHYSPCGYFVKLFLLDFD